MCIRDSVRQLPLLRRKEATTNADAEKSEVPQSAARSYDRQMCIRDRIMTDRQLINLAEQASRNAYVIQQRDLERDADPVSYTHLDVYKRQARP